MFRSDCLNCLCKFCTRGSCRYPCDICFARCLSSGRPLMFCVDFQHRARHCIYFYRKRPGGVSDYIKRMSVSDFLGLVGDLIDKKRD